MTQEVAPGQIEALLRPYLQGKKLPELAFQRFAMYLDLLLRWNARTNLTAVREPTLIVQRHFGESVFAAASVGTCETLLDFGSGAGFPGLPIQILRPEMRVTLGESQNKKASFLREAVRTLELNTEVWGGRVEAMSAERIFDIVTMRAVDNMRDALLSAASRASRGLVVLCTADAHLAHIEHFVEEKTCPIPGTTEGQVRLLTRGESIVPRGTRGSVPN